jgi:predicted RNase H-like HicB family nuclease
MARQIQLNISLTPVVRHDIDTELFLIWYDQFPEAFAEGKSIEEAENNLIPVLELMWKERPRELEKKLLDQYINDSHRSNPKIVFPNK